MSSTGMTPPGLNAIYSALRRIYPQQQNPLQVTALVKYWLNGPDPLDFVSMYANEGDARIGVPPHWHYISCGLSDLHGDGRVHNITSGDDSPSGFGFELTFRLKRGVNERIPPTWPAELMQSIAKYVFSSEATLCSGDHVSWHSPIDFINKFINQMLLADDPQLEQIITPFGYVNFIQVVGVCTEELQAAQYWNGPGLINLLRQVPSAGGNWLVTNTERNVSIFEINPNLREFVEISIDQDGSDLSGVNAKIYWNECSSETIMAAASRACNGFSDADRPSSSTLSIRIRSSLANHRSEASENDEPNSISRLSNYSSVSDLLRARPIMAGLQLRFNYEAATLLPLAIRGRLAHGRHFTFKSPNADSAITFVSRDVTGTSVDEHKPYAALRTWLQVLIPDDFLELLAHDFEELSRPNEISLPRLYAWPDRNLMITVVDNSN